MSFFAIRNFAKLFAEKLREFFEKNDKL